MLAFDSNLAPIVGQQVTLTAKTGDDGRRGSRSSRRAPRRASAIWWSTARPADARWASLYNPPTARFIPDRAHKQPLADADLRALARDADLTFTAVPPGSGRRIGIDRDLDGVLDGDEGSGHLAQVW